MRRVLVALALFASVLAGGVATDAVGATEAYARAVSDTSVRVGDSVRIEGSGCPSPPEGQTVAVTFVLTTATTGGLGDTYSISNYLGDSTSYSSDVVWDFPFYVANSNNFGDLIGSHNVRVECTNLDGASNRTTTAVLGNVAFEYSAAAYSFEVSPSPPAPGEEVTVRLTGPCAENSFNWIRRDVGIYVDTATASKALVQDGTSDPLTAREYTVTLPEDALWLSVAGWCMADDDPSTYSTFWYRPVQFRLEPATRPPVPPSNALNWVAIGDSYSSGEGTYQYSDNTYQFSDSPCHRGPHAWPAILDGADNTVALSDHAACTGAETHQLFHEYKGLVQVDPASPDASVDLVAVTIGGNDVRFSAVLTNCFISRTQIEPRGLSRRSIDPLGCMNTGEYNRYFREVEELHRTLTAETYPRLRRAFPYARIVHVGYPEIFPTADSSDSCHWLSDVEKRNLKRAYDTLHTFIRSAAQSSQHDIEYVHTGDLFDGRELCRAGSFLQPILGPTEIFGTEQGHPNIEGQERWADFLSGHLTGV